MFDEYIDSHTHMHALNWDEWELLGTTGMRTAVKDPTYSAIP